MIVWVHPTIRQDSGFRFFRENFSEHRQKLDGRPIMPGGGCELIAYEPTDSGPQKIWYLRANIENDGIGEPVELAGFACRFVDPLTIGQVFTQSPGAKAATKTARNLIAARRKRFREIVEGYRERRKSRWAWFWRLLGC